MHILHYACIILSSTVYFAYTIEPSLELEEHPIDKRGPGVIPNPFVWRPDAHHVLVFHRKGVRKSKKAGDRPEDNPGFSPNNWRHAVYAASDKISAMQQQAQADLTDPIPGNHFQYEESAENSRGPLRKVKFEMEGDAPFQLEYGRVHTILYGLLEYEKIWVKPSMNDQ
ncbi:MAG: hypothetical protein Q9226_005436, partial [Calogaya cf. arnoldii]